MSSAWVAVSPPLFAKGPSCGSVLRRSPVALRKPPGAAVESPPAASSERLWPKEVNVPDPTTLKFAEAVVDRAKMLFVTSTVPPLLEILLGLELFTPRLLAKVQFVTVIFALP